MPYVRVNAIRIFREILKSKGWYVVEEGSHGWEDPWEPDRYLEFKISKKKLKK